MTEHEDEYEGVTLYVDASEDWPNNLAGVMIHEQRVYVENGKVKIIGDPIWKFGEEDDND